MDQEKFHYMIEVNCYVTGNYSIVETKQIVCKSHESHFTFSNLSAISTCMFRIRSVNDHGSSIIFTQITIHEEKALPPKPSNVQVFMVRYGQYDVRWEGIVDRVKIDHYVLSWCPGKPGKCNGEIKSEIIGHQIQSKTLSNLTGMGYNFGVSSVVTSDCGKSHFVSSSITWATCVVLPMKPSKKLRFTLTNTDDMPNSLQLRWMNPYGSCPGSFSRFEIIYCRLTGIVNGSCGESNRIFVNNSLAESYKLEGLYPDALYRVSMKGWNWNNTASSESDYLEARTGTFGHSALWCSYILLAIVFSISTIRWILKVAETNGVRSQNSVSNIRYIALVTYTRSQKELSID